MPFRYGAAFFCVDFQAVRKNMHKFKNNTCAVLLRECMFVSMKTTQLHTAEAYRANAFANCGKSLMIVMMDGFYFVTSRREAMQLANSGYEIF